MQMSKRIIINIIILLCVLVSFFFILLFQCKILTPLNGLSIMFYTPKDFYSPYNQCLIKENVYKYQLNYIHKYVGDHSVILNVVNNAPKKFDYDNPDRIDLILSVNFNNAGNKTNTLFRFDKKIDEYFLNKGTNQIFIATYSFSDMIFKNKPYMADIEIKGNVKKFLSTYPKSFLSIQNTTHK